MNVGDKVILKSSDSIGEIIGRMPSGQGGLMEDVLVVMYNGIKLRLPKTQMDLFFSNIDAIKKEALDAEAPKVVKAEVVSIPEPVIEEPLPVSEKKTTTKSKKKGK